MSNTSGDWKETPTPLDPLERDNFKHCILSITWGRKQIQFSKRSRNWKYGRKDPSRWPRGIPFPQMLAVTSPTSGSRSIGIVRLRNYTTEFSSVWFLTIYISAQWSNSTNPVILRIISYIFLSLHSMRVTCTTFSALAVSHQLHIGRYVWTVEHT
jgi:hypothetical protein